MRLNFYTHAELETIVTRGAGVLKVAISRGRRRRDRAPLARHAAHRRPPAAPRARFRRRGRTPRPSPPRWRTARCRQLEVDSEGLDALDHRYLSCIARNYDGGPVGIETISAALSEPRDALEEIVEPFLLQQGFIGRTPRGRVLTLRAYKHLGLTGPARAATPQIGLFDEAAEEGCSGQIRDRLTRRLQRDLPSATANPTH